MMGYHVWFLEQWYFTESRATAVKLLEAHIEEARYYCDPEWPDWVVDARAVYARFSIPNHERQKAKPALIASQCNVEGPDGELDEDMCDEQGRCFMHVETYCDYEVVAVTQGVA